MHGDRTQLTRFAWLSIAAAIATITLKLLAWRLTGSVGLFSDAAESLVNLVAAILALVALTIAARPADEAHEHGYDKAEFFSSGVEGALILVAAVAIGWSAFPRLFDPQPLEQTGIGLAVSAVATAVNFGVARVLLTASRKYGSITLEADAHHLMTDVWTSVGVVAAVGLVAVTGWIRLDPIIAMIVAAQIIFTGVGLIRRSLMGLLDPVLPLEEREKVQALLERYADREGIKWHALRTRQSAARRFLNVHILVPGDWTVKRGHDLVDALEAELRQTLPMLHVTTHLEPVDDEAAYVDEAL